MGKKLFWIILFLGLVAFAYYVVPDLIAQKKADNAVKDAQTQDYVDKRAAAITGTGGSNEDSGGDSQPGFAGKALNKARDRSEKANNRSADYVEDQGL